MLAEGTRRGASNLFHAIIVKIRTRAAASNRFSRFTCGDCERNEQCGLAPHDDCLVKAMQIARDDDERVPPPTMVAYRGVWPS
jgi:hypothetical protein